MKLNFYLCSYLFSLSTYFVKAECPESIVTLYLTCGHVRAN